MKEKRSIMVCDVCKMNKEGVKIRRAKYGKTKMYSACPDCQKSMLLTQQNLDLSHKKALSSGKYKSKPGSLVLIPLNA